MIASLRESLPVSATSASSGRWPCRGRRLPVEQSGTLRFGNDLVELELDASSGYFRQIRNKKTGVEHKPPSDGVWPYGVWVGTREEPERMKAEIRADGIQKMTLAVERIPGATIMHPICPMLADNTTKTATGVGLGVEVPAQSP